VLPISVHHYNGIASGTFQARAERQLFSKISTQPDGAQVAAHPRFILNLCPRIIGRAIIDQNHFETAPGLFQCALQIR
jgi:hypothetical protein